MINQQLDHSASNSDLLRPLSGFRIKSHTVENTADLIQFPSDNNNNNSRNNNIININNSNNSNNNNSSSINNNVSSSINYKICGNNTVCNNNL